MKKSLEKIKLHTFHIALLLLVVLVLGSIGIGLLLVDTSFTLGFDSFFYELIHKGPHFHLLDLLITPFNYNFLPPQISPLMLPSYYYFMFFATLFYAVIWNHSQIKWVIFCFIFGTFLAMGITALDWHFVFRDRPFLTLPNDVDLIGRSAWEKLSSFPSGHARETTLYGTLMANFIPRLRWTMIIFVIFIAYSRIYIGAHFPTDVIAGVLIGYITAKVTLIIARELQIILEKKGELHGNKPQGTN